MLRTKITIEQLETVYEYEINFWEHIFNFIDSDQFGKMALFEVDSLISKYFYKYINKLSMDLKDDQYFISIGMGRLPKREKFLFLIKKDQFKKQFIELLTCYNIFVKEKSKGTLEECSYMKPLFLKKDKYILLYDRIRHIKS
jgi:hypothetical protein